MASDGGSNVPINLMRGWPNKSLLPTDLIRSAAQKALADPAIAGEALEYGPDPGYEPLRRSLADWLASFYQPDGRRTASSNLTITGGASQSLGAILSVYTDPSYTTNVWIVAPAYMLAFSVFEDAGFAGRMRAIPEDDEGIDVEYLRTELRKSAENDRREGRTAEPKYKPRRSWAKVYRHVIYAVPTFANPSSRSMSLQRREALVGTAREFDALIVADDVYDFLQWPAGVELLSSPRLSTAHLPRLVDIDRSLNGGADRKDSDGFGNACSNGSFSKIAGPGIRVGWVEGTPKFAYGVSQCGTTRSGGAPSQLTSTYVHELLISGNLQHHIETVLQPAYASNYRSLMAAITSHLVPLGFASPQQGRRVVGGFFVWLSLPSTLSASALAKRCNEDVDVILAPGSIFEVPGDESAVGFDGHVRLCFAWESENRLTEGVKRVAMVARSMLDEERRGYVVVERVSSGDMREFK